MTLSEFKAWFEGYTEGLEATPTKAQFDRIKEKVKEIDGAPIVQTIWLDSYRRYYPYYPYDRSYAPAYGPYWGGLSTGMGQVTTTMNASPVNQSQSAGNAFNSTEAMFALGKAEAVN